MKTTKNSKFIEYEKTKNRKNIERYKDQKITSSKKKKIFDVKIFCHIQKHVTRMFHKYVQKI